MYKRLITVMLTIVLSTFMSMSAFAQNTQVGYTVTSNYEITIPAYINLNTDNQLKIEATFLSLMDGYDVNVYIDKNCLRNGTLVLESSEGNTINTEINVISNGACDPLSDNLLVAQFNKNGLQLGGELSINAMREQYTYAGEYYGTLIFETELVQE